MPSRQATSTRLVDVHVHFAQSHLNARLHGLNAHSFHPDGVAVYTASSLKRPPGYAGFFGCVSHDHHRLSLSLKEQQRLPAVSAILVFCDTLSSRQMADAKALLRCIDGLKYAPPIFLLPHSSDPPDKLQCSSDVTLEFFIGAREEGFDGYLLGEPSGFRLALAVQSEIIQQRRRVETLEHNLNQRKESVERAQITRCAMEEDIWTYLRSRMESCMVPPLDHDIGPCETGSTVCGFKVGDLLGEGSYGKVYELMHPANSTSTGDVMKVLPKKQMMDYKGFIYLNHQLKVMNMLRKHWRHLNIGELRAVYHSANDVMLQMQNGGDINLHQRLLARDNECVSLHRPLGVAKAASVVSQCLSAVCHLHMGPRVVHRDIKPENITVAESEHSIATQLIDFDLAYVMGEKDSCCGKAGSFLFMAPEITFQSRYDPFAADIWSAAVVCLEVLFGVNILTRVLRFPSRERKERAKVIIAYLQDSDSIDNLLKHQMKKELSDLAEASAILLHGMLEVRVAERWTADCVSQELDLHGIFREARNAIKDTPTRELAQ